MIATPLQKLSFFKEKLSLNERELEKLAPFREIFTSKKYDFSDYFYNFFSSIPETKIFLEHYETPGFLRKAWAYWFESLFTKNLNEEFMHYLWKIGIRHVEVNLDQRFSNLGFHVARQFCHQIILSEIPYDRVGIVSSVVDKLIDFCLLVETDAYIETSTYCDIEIVKGFADRVRNKITIIGGYIKRLQRHTDINDPSYAVYDSLISESTTCEQMVFDTKNYIEMSQNEPVVQETPLEKLINAALERLHVKDKYKDIRIDIQLDSKVSSVMGDRWDIENIFYHLIQNSIEAVDKKNPYIKISSSFYDRLPGRLQIEIFNTGTPPKEKDIDKLFVPFFSTKPFGTGFGLPIARLAIRRNYGRIFMQPVPGQGTKVIINLPCPG